MKNLEFTYLAWSLFLNTNDTFIWLRGRHLFSRISWLWVLFTRIFVRLLFTLVRWVRRSIRRVPCSLLVWINNSRCLIVASSCHILWDPLGDLLLPSWLVIHCRLTRALVEGRLLVALRGACCTRIFHNDFTIPNILHALILRHESRLLLELSGILCRDNLLAASQILNISPPLTWLLPLLLYSCFLAFFFADGVLLRHLHVAVTRFVEALLRLHRIRAICLDRCESHFRICTTIWAWSDAWVLTTSKGIERCVATLLTWRLASLCRPLALIWAGSLDKALVIGSWVLLAWNRCQVVGNLHRL